MKIRKRIVKKSLRIFSKYKMWFGIAVVVLLGFLFISFLSPKKKESNKKKPVDSMVAPYYEKKAFERPLFLPTPATKEATLEPFKIPIVMYHYVEYVQDAGDLIRKRLDIIPATFERHLKDLRGAGYDTYFVKDVPDILNGNIHYSPKSVILSFDDGYEDFYTVVFPLLKKYHMRATLYVIYDFIGRKGFVTHDQIQELIDSDLVEIGSHTLDHLYLKGLPDKIVEKQIKESKKKFEEDYHIKIFTFAYPYGAMSPYAIQQVKEAGYTTATSVISGTLQSEENLFFLSRIRPGYFSNGIVSSLEGMKK